MAPLAIAGALLCAAQVLMWSLAGAWPFHDTAAYWLAGVHFREGLNPYAGDATFLAMKYAPPWVVLTGVVSLVPLEIVTLGLLAGQVLALRYIAGSWRVAGLLGWLPFVPRELVTGNVDLLMAAAILLAVHRGTTAPVALFALAKFAPVLALAAPGVRRRHAVVTALILVAITLPWLSLWPQWVEVTTRAQVGLTVPILPRIPIVVGLLLYRKPWSVALAAGLATPAFYFHSLVLLLPGLRLLIPEQRPQDP